MKKTVRLSAQERRRDIVDAVRDVFADKGFDGTTTRDLAKSAGVSEALLYRYFPSERIPLRGDVGCLRQGSNLR